MSGPTQAESDNPNIERMEMELELPCELTPEQVDDLAQRMADTQATMEGAEAEAKEAAADYRQQIKSHKNAMHRLSNKVRTRTFSSLVLCVIEFDHEHAKKKTTRDDTGESWEETMTAEELQRNFLPREGPSPEEGGGKPGRKRCNCPVVEGVVSGETWACPQHGRMIVDDDGSFVSRDPELLLEGEDGQVEADLEAEGEDPVADSESPEVGEDDEGDESAAAADAVKGACDCSPHKDNPTAGDSWECWEHGPMWVGPDHQVEPRPPSTPAF